MGSALGCVNPASWLPLAAGGEFTQPRAYLLADPCMVLSLLFRFKSMSASAEMFVDDETISSNISVPVVEERYTDNISFVPVISL